MAKTRVSKKRREEFFNRVHYLYSTWSKYGDKAAVARQNPLDESFAVEELEKVGHRVYTQMVERFAVIRGLDISTEGYEDAEWYWLFDKG